MYIIKCLLLTLPLLWVIVDAQEPVPETVKDYEEHTVTTDDGYILVLHHIPCKTNNPSPNQVLFVHGLFGSSWSWRLNGPQSLPIVLAENGHDSWMINCRLNGESKDIAPDATGLAVKDKWNFSMHELAIYDITAAINYILKFTQKEKVTYIGHSLGGLLYFLMCLAKPEYQKKVNIYLGLAPLLSMIKVPTLFQAAILAYPFSTMDKFNFDIGSPFAEITHGVCATGEYACKESMLSISGGNGSEYSTENNNEYLKYLPASESSKVTYHVVQGFYQKGYRMFDYGWYTNLQKYGSFVPPTYQLNKVADSPKYIFYGGKDNCILKESMKVGFGQLVNVQDVFFYESYGHFDFTQGKNVYKQVYLKIVDICSSL